MLGNSHHNERQELMAGHRYEFTVNRIVSKLLEKPYKTSCHWYGKWGNGIQSRHQCIDNCVIGLYRDKCRCLPIHLTNTVMLLNASEPTVCTLRDSSMRTDSCYDIISKDIGMCLTTDNCPNNCQSIRYTCVRKVDKLLTLGDEWMVGKDNSVDTGIDKRVVVKIRLDESFGTIVETHIPLITFGQLLAYISALIAIVSGLSFFGFTNFLVEKMPEIRFLINNNNTKIGDNNTTISGQLDGLNGTASTSRVGVIVKKYLQQKNAKHLPSHDVNERMSTATTTTTVECISNGLGSPKRQLLMTPTNKRPATSGIYESG
ncbi:uncharacterized protein LOC128955480 [Oppia nitens]|uniref:uncharacterized protein LOC128955480 n=1 Tax=Oppia nitens TaxID=1686743 RepID=UPI0023DC6820|nr:uncharacterized protein LOC128955480 [Oppia nitens]